MHRPTLHMNTSWGGVSRGISSQGRGGVHLLLYTDILCNSQYLTTFFVSKIDIVTIVTRIPLSTSTSLPLLLVPLSRLTSLPLLLVPLSRLTSLPLLLVPLSTSTSLPLLLVPLSRLTSLPLLLVPLSRLT